MPYLIQAATAANPHRKPVAQITDRAKRYRAYETPPPGPRRCERCGSTRNVVIDHRDGDESNGRRRNLRWLCQSCNVRLGARNKRLGRGVPTRQYNPPPVREMTGGQINKELASNSAQQSKVTDQLIAAGRGYERISEIRTKSDALSVKYGALLDRYADLMNEARARYGPDFTRGAKLSGPRTRHYNPNMRYTPEELARPRTICPICRDNLSESIPVPAGLTCPGCGTFVAPKAAPKKPRKRNPGAKNLAAYTEAVLGHQRGAHDWGGEIIHDTPIEHRRKFAREIWRRRRGEAPQRVNLNPAPMSEAIERYKLFHGRAPREVLDAQRSDVVRKTLWIVGEHPSLVGLEIAGPDCDLDALDFESMDANDEIDGAIPLEFDGDNVDLASDPRGHQLYLIGGDQSLDAQDLEHFGTDTKKDLIELGPAVAVEYQARKPPKYQLARYRHFLGEHSGQQPLAYYDRLKKEIALVGGSYRVKDWIYD